MPPREQDSSNMQGDLAKLRREALATPGSCDPTDLSCPREGKASQTLRPPKS